MRLSSDGTTFEMEVVGYQFPNSKEQYDADWLNSRIAVRVPQGSWTSTDPSLLTWELASLIEWLESVAKGEPVDPEVSFTEPNLRFELHGTEPLLLRIYFELESRPGWAPADGAGMDDLWAEFPIDESELMAGAASLRKYLAWYPIRLGYRRS